MILNKKLVITALMTAITTISVTGCSQKEMPNAATENTGVTITNCGKAVTYTSPQKWFVNDVTLLSTVLAIGAQDKIRWTTSVQRDLAALQDIYPAAKSPTWKDEGSGYPALETLVAASPDIYIAGWNYGLSETKNLTPTTLAEHNIQTYLLTESCRPEETNSQRGIVDPWDAINIDLENLGTLAGTQQQAAEIIADINDRRTALTAAPQATKKPVVFVYDSGTEALFTSGKFGGPQAVITAAGGQNATADLENTWTTVSWEKVAASSPDVFVFVDYEGQTMAEKIAQLEQNPATKDLPAVKEHRYVNLPYVYWTSNPLNIDAAEQLRKALENFGLVPTSSITPKHQLGNQIDGQNFWQRAK